ncbi:HmuY family protein [Isoalcanivorax beigongshangi]|uniref:HmuY family protein n=1 Tax=Isoalcanivorax beigongshangi TaxID=3238810 RepID=A0ABV4AMC9_9GAMM
MRSSILTLTLGLSAALLAGCGSSSSSNSTPNPGPGPGDGNRFSGSAEWRFELPAKGDSLCFDFNANREVPDCSGNDWDLKVLSTGSYASFWTHSGVTADGQGGAFNGPFDYSWSELSQWQNATTDPKVGQLPSTLYVADFAKSVFVGDNMIQSSVFEYGLGGSSDHNLYPNYRVFLITDNASNADALSGNDNKVFALQVVGYYGGPSGTASGWPTLRWFERSSDQGNQTLREETIDASSETQWVHFNLDTGAVVDAPEQADWHVALRRNSIKLNAGISGTGNAGGFIGATPAGFYDANGKPVASVFRRPNNADLTRADLTNNQFAVPTNASGWIKDSAESRLNSPYRGTYPAPLNFGWFTYYSTDAAAAEAGVVKHMIKANPDGAALIRGADGSSYARFHLTEVAYSDPQVATSAQTWTLQFEVQPAE